MKRTTFLRAKKKDIKHGPECGPSWGSKCTHTHFFCRDRSPERISSRQHQVLFLDGRSRVICRFCVVFCSSTFSTLYKVSALYKVNMLLCNRRKSKKGRNKIATFSKARQFHCLILPAPKSTCCHLLLRPLSEKPVTPAFLWILAWTITNPIWKHVFGIPEMVGSPSVSPAQAWSDSEEPNLQEKDFLWTAGACFLKFQGLGLIAAQTVGMCETLRWPDTKAPVLPFISVQKMKVRVWLFLVGAGWGRGRGQGERVGERWPEDPIPWPAASSRTLTTAR